MYSARAVSTKKEKTGKAACFATKSAKLLLGVFRRERREIQTYERT